MRAAVGVLRAGRHHVPKALLDETPDPRLQEINDRFGICAGAGLHKMVAAYRSCAQRNAGRAKLPAPSNVPWECARSEQGR